jgi:hypothetical protein
MGDQPVAKQLSEQDNTNTGTKGRLDTDICDDSMKRGDSSVAIVIRLRACRSENRLSILGGEGYDCSRPDRLWSPHNFVSNGNQG